ncbi:MAG: Txe/YoeB family addiction module toxin [Schwartzia sp.]|nr:Txe/YoeB family addiction module toxin [Schwartzia sp. (in: firmicutes)]
MKDIERNGYAGLRKPEPLKGELAGFWSVRIDEKNRIVFRICEENLEIWQCGSHYRDR